MRWSDKSDKVLSQKGWVVRSFRRKYTFDLNILTSEAAVIPSPCKVIPSHRGFAMSFSLWTLFMVFWMATSCKVLASDRASGFLAGTPVCFKIRASSGNPWSYALKLVAEPQKSGSGVPIAAVHGLMHGTRPQGEITFFYAELFGTATKAPWSGDPKGPPALQIGLVESDLGPDDTVSGSGLWAGTFGLILSPESFKGEIIGKYSFTPIARSGADLGPVNSHILREPLELMDCKGF